MKKINFENKPSTKTPVNANNLNRMQDNIEAEIDAINASADTQRQLYAKGWYRIAKASTKVATACIIKLGTSYSNQTPMTAMLSIATSYDTASINLLDCQLKGSNVHFSKARVQHDSTNEVFYLDVYYDEENVTNTMYANLIAKDGFWKIAESTDVTEYTTLCEISTTGIISGTEFKTGRIIDGKIEYGKRIAISTLPNATTSSFVHGITDFTLTHLEGFAKSGTTQIPIPYYNTASNFIRALVGGTTVNIATGSDMSDYSGHITLYYTKNS